MKPKNKNYKKIIAITLFAVVVLIGSGIIFRKTFNSKNDNVNVSDTETQQPQEPINYNPPTEEEKQESDQKKKEIVKQQAENPVAPADSNVVPIISDAGVYDGQIEVSSFVPGIVESGGNCTAKFVNGNSVLTKEATAINDATTTRCTNFVIPATEFNPNGEWTVTISYSSTKSRGTSEPKALEVQ